jgi:hypothetical protein
MALAGEAITTLLGLLRGDGDLDARGLAPALSMRSHASRLSALARFMAATLPAAFSLAVALWKSLLA